MENVYKTTDLYLSAFLKARGIPLIDKEESDGKVSFLFEDTKERIDLVKEFFNDGLVNITRFKSAIQDLKTMIYRS